MKLNLNYLIAALCVLAFVLGAFLVRGCESRKMKRTGNHSRKAASILPRIPVLDTAKVPVIEPITPKAPTVVPVLTRLQIKPDLPRRKRLEQRASIIIGIRKTADSLYIQTISPRGIVLENSFPEVYAAGKFEIDSTGQLHIDPDEYRKQQISQRRKRRWQRVWRTTKTVAVSALVGWAGYQIGKGL